MENKIESAQELQKVQMNQSKDSLKQNKQPQPQPPSISFCAMFRFATCLDWFLMTVGAIGGLCVGAALPAFSFLWGRITDDIVNGGDGMVEATKETMLIFIYVGLGIFFAGWLMFSMWMISGQRQAIKCRKAYLKALLHQEIGWFDLNNQAELSSRFATDTIAFQAGISQKVPTLLMALGTLIAGFVFAFITGWLMSLVIVAVLPMFGIAGAFFVFVLENKDKRQKKLYAKAGGRAQQAIQSIKTIKQLNGEPYETRIYQNSLQQTSGGSKAYGFLSGAGIGSLFFVMLAAYALGFWFGSKCVSGAENCPTQLQTQGPYSAGDVLVIFFSLLMAGFNLNQIGPSLKSITLGRQAGARIFPILDRQPEIRNCADPIKPQNIQGVIRFENVTFAYPKEKQRIVLSNFSAQFDINSSAVVGQSGCGKSTTLQLIMRYYDPDQGRITLDGHDLRKLDLGWLRQNIGYVGQQPVLFAASIKENLLFGKQTATDEEIDEALRKAEAYKFVNQLQNKIDTYVGMGGGQISGGQKQRIAIARALLKNPKILLFDEATSALDRRNERLIQQTLNSVAEGRTSITVAHRVETIKKSNVIYVLDKGTVKEKGRFGELERYKSYKHSQEEESMEKKERVEEIKDEEEAEEKKEQKKENEEQKQKKEQQQLLQRYEGSTFGRIFSYSKDQIGFFILGIIFALANGTIFPIFSLFLAEMFVVLGRLQFFRPNPLQQDIDDANRLALYFFILGIAALVCHILQIGFIHLVGESITKKIRLQVFEKILKMPIPWFEVSKNSSGALSARLASDCVNVNSLTTSLISVALQSLSTLITGLIIAFIYEWRTSLVALGLLPLMIIAGALEMQFQAGFNQKSDDAYKDSSSLIMQALINIRTVTSFGVDNVIVSKYDQRLEKPQSLSIKKGLVAGLLFGFSQFILYIVFGLILYLGSIFVRDNEDASVQDMFVAVFGIVFAAMTAGNNMAFMPDFAAAKISAANLFFIIDSTDEDQLQYNAQSKMVNQGASGNISLQNVTFKYSSRNEYVLKNLSINIKKGQKVAFVGTSGCGKSTIMSLLLRFYFPESGKITLNGINIQDYNVHYLRSLFGVVSQQPTLFNGSFAENIQYNRQNTSQKQLRQAAEKANALKFILQNQNEEKMEDIKKEEGDNKTGFDRNVGIKGSHISGGQKQRVAIARAIIRNPEILLLDEATSALDSKNEEIIQESLDKIMTGKTTISIAHRISTIKNSDKIYVFGKGQIIEEGVYDQLVEQKGYFYKLEKGIQFM